MPSGVQAPQEPGDRGRLEVLWADRERDPERVRAAALTCAQTPERQVLLAYLDWRTGQLERVVTTVEPLRAVLPAGAWRVRALNLLGNVRGELGLPEAALELLHECLDTAHRLADPEGEGMALHDLGTQLMTRMPERSRSYLEQALTHARTHDLKLLEMMALFNLSVLAFNNRQQADFDRYVVALEALPPDLSPDLTRLSLVMRADHAQAHGREEERRAFLRQLRQLPPSRDPAVQFNLRVQEARLAVQAGNPGQAITHLEALLASSDDEFRGLLLEPLGEAYEASGNLREALRLARESTAFWREFLGGQRERQVQALEVLHRTEQARAQADWERQRATELQDALTELRSAHERIRELSVRDILTGLHNRLHLMHEAPAVLAGPDGARTQVAVIDLDRFKRINDLYGHAAGDEVLRGLADSLGGFLRPGDLGVRYGGDEFVVLRPGGPNAPHLASDLRQFTGVLAGRRWRHCPVPVTASVGVVQAGADSLDALLARADLTMYAAKHAGGNRVAQGEPKSGPSLPE